MLEYIEQFLGLDAGRLDSDVGIMLAMCIFAILLFATFRGVIIWIKRLFGGK